MRIEFRILAAIATILLPVSVCSAQSRIHVYPIAGLFVPTGNARQWVTNEFTEAVNLSDAGKFFFAEFLKAFPESVQVINNRNKRRTFVVSLQVTRASTYQVSKIDGTSDIYVPITGSIYFTNLVTGEVLYTASHTHYETRTLAGQQETISKEHIRQLLQASYKAMTSELVLSARRDFHPTEMASTVKSERNGLYILDRGENGGMAVGDVLVDDNLNTLRIVSTGAAYSIGLPELGKIEVGLKFAKQTNQTISELKKPRVMILVDKVPKEISSDVVGQIFADQLGVKAPISVIHVNPMFAKVLSTAFTQAEISDIESSKRELPDFFVRVSVIWAKDFELPTHLKYKTKRSNVSIATAELIDRNGRVLFAAQGNDRIDDDVTSGMGFNPANRRDISIKNALLSLAEKFNKELKFRKIELPIVPTPNGIEIKDDLGTLVVGQETIVYRNIGPVDGIQGDVYLPLTHIKVDSVTDGSVKANLGFAFTSTSEDLKKGDIVRIGTSQHVPTITRKKIGSCGSVVKLGTVDLPAFGELALTQYARNSTAPYFEQGLNGSLQGLLGATSNFGKSFSLQDTPLDYCIEPVYRIDLSERACKGDPLTCAAVLNLRITYRIKQGESIVAKSGLEQKLISTMFFANANPLSERLSVEADLLDEISKLAPAIVMKLNQSF